MASNGRGCTLGKACAVKPAIADDGKPWEAFLFILGLPPLQYTKAEISAMNLTGHTGHASPPEYGRDLGEPLRLGPVPVPPGLEAGFSGPDCDALGHWLRDAGAKQEANATAAARAAGGDEARAAAARASLPGRTAIRQQSRIYYNAGSTQNRRSERDVQLCVRQRLMHTLRAVISHYGVSDLPRGQENLKLLRVRHANTSA